MLHHVSVLPSHRFCPLRRSDVTDPHVVPVRFEECPPALPCWIVGSSHLFQIASSAFLRPSGPAFVTVPHQFLPSKNTVAMVRTNRGLASFQMACVSFNYLPAYPAWKR